MFILLLDIPNVGAADGETVEWALAKVKLDYSIMQSNKGMNSGAAVMLKVCQAAGVVLRVSCAAVHALMRWRLSGDLFYLVSISFDRKIEFHGSGVFRCNLGQAQLSDCRKNGCEAMEVGELAQSMRIRQPCNDYDWRQI